MPFSSGTYTWPSNTFTPSPTTGTTISSTDAASSWSDAATALSTCLLKDGSQTVTANIPMAGFKFTGLGAGSSATDSATIGNTETLAAKTLTSPTFGATQPIMVDAFTNVCDGRLTLTSATPVTTADVTAAGTLYFTPYKGNRIALYDGSAHWNVLTFSEVSLALSLSSGKPYDIFAYNNSGSLAIESLVWTNDTTRATALALQNGVLVKSGTTTRRYIGTIYSSGANTTEDSYAKRYVWNYYNRVKRPMRVLEATASWTYTTATLRQANGAATNQLDMVIGVSEDEVNAQVLVTASNSGAADSADLVAGIGVDSTSAMATGVLVNRNRNMSGAGIGQSIQAFWRGFPGAGRHTIVWLEYSTASGTTTWYGIVSSGLLAQSGIHGEILS